MNYTREHIYGGILFSHVCVTLLCTVFLLCVLQVRYYTLGSWYYSIHNRLLLSVHAHNVTCTHLCPGSQIYALCLCLHLHTSTRNVTIVCFDTYRAANCMVHLGQRRRNSDEVVLEQAA